MALQPHFCGAREGVRTIVGWLQSLGAQTRYSACARDEPPEHHHIEIVPNWSHHNSTTMTPIEAAIKAIKSREAGESFSYRQVAKRFGVNQTTLSRTHQGKQSPNAVKIQQQLLLSPQQESKLVQYIEKCTRRGLPPTREMVQNFALSIAKQKVSES